MHVKVGKRYTNKDIYTARMKRFIHADLLGAKKGSKRYDYWGGGGEWDCQDSAWPAMGLVYLMLMNGLNQRGL